LEKTSAGSTGFHKTGTLVVSDSRERLGAIRREVELSQHRSLPAEFLDNGNKIKRIVPALNEAGLAGGGYTPDDGYFDPTAIAVTYASEARKRGARILTGTKVTRILRSGQRVSGVETTNGNFNFDLVINAAGAWAHQINQMVPLDLPLWHSKGNVFILRPSAPLGYKLPILLYPKFYIRPEGERFFACAHPPHSANESMAAEHNTFDPDALPLSGGTESHALEYMSNEIAQKIPILANSSVVNNWLAYRMQTNDGLPIVGESPVPGFMLAVGLGGNGVVLAPAVGMALAESITAGGRSMVKSSILAELLTEFGVGRLNCR
jgi:glycine/D-amino acid oxidase-like deaminating enzyme